MFAKAGDMDMLDEDDHEREPLLRACLQQLVVRADVNEGVDHEALHVYLHHGDLPLFACVVLSVKDNEDRERTGFWWHAVDEQWPNFNVERALRTWCALNFPGVQVPKFELVDHGKVVK